MLKALSRVKAIMLKELIQMRRDRLTFAMMIMLPIVQLILFGSAINSDPRHLPTYLYLEEDSALVRTLVSGFKTSSYYDITGMVHTADEGEAALRSGKVAFVITVPAGFSRSLLRGEPPTLLIEADATDPSATSNAVGQANLIVLNALQHDLKGVWQGLNQGPPPVNTVVHLMYNPEGITQYNIVPGLLGVILTMTMIMITSIAMTREIERGNMENLLAMPARPWEVMVGKISPYIGVGIVQTTIVLLAARFIFNVPFVGQGIWLGLGIALFIIANLAVGFTFSTIAKSQMQAMQMTFFFFLPSLLLSGFMFPFRGMPIWAQTIGSIFPLTHFLRIVRGVMLKGGNFQDLWPSYWPLMAFICVATFIAMKRYKVTLD